MGKNYVIKKKTFPLLYFKPVEKILTNYRQVLDEAENGTSESFFFNSNFYLLISLILFSDFLSLTI